MVVQAGGARHAPRVAVIDVDGLILNTPFVGPLSVGENPVALFREKLEAAAADRCVRGVVVRVNSHGGGVAACISMRHDLERFKANTGLPVVACLMDTATGGAYYLASAADQIVAAASGHRIRTGAAVHITDQDGARTRVSDPGANAHLVLAASAIAAGVTAAGTSRSAMCVVASTTRSVSDASIIATRLPVSAASISVWPG